MYNKATYNVRAGLCKLFEKEATSNLNMQQYVEKLVQIGGFCICNH